MMQQKERPVNSANCSRAKEEILLCYLRAGNRFDGPHGRIDERYCRQVLGIDDPPAAVATLRRQGHRVKISDDGIGIITLFEEAIQ